jgi:pectinesterase
MKRHTFLALALLPTLLSLPSRATGGPSSFTVAADGSGQFTSVQAAIDAAPESSKERIVIHIKPGVYKEYISVPPSKTYLTFQGEDANKTILTLDRAASKKRPDGTNYGTSGSASAQISGSNFTAENITFENSAGRGKEVGQAVAIKVTADRSVFRKCRFLGWQDTLYAGSGRQYYKDCYIEGDVDFIFGSAAAVFEDCRIHSKGNGYVTAQARTEPEQPIGYVFRRCTLTSAPDVQPNSVYLGRPWRPYARVVYTECTLGAHIRPTGWDNWGKAENEKTAWFAEHASKGPGATSTDATVPRVPWARQLGSADMTPFETKRFLAGEDGWVP